ncbi:MAG: hypothetical protein K2N09_08105 [Muribaculaceae bacterium]|nr:hypothetical protein [Muribaculaceae bacterium]
MEIRKEILAGLMIASVATAVHAEYTLKISQGKYPEGVKTENLNGNLPEESWYKRGWTKDGWSTGYYGTTYSVALSPSRITDGSVCENALTLPSIKIEEGEWLSWKGCEVYPLFSDSYTVEFRQKGKESWIELGEYTEERSIWSTHMIDLSPYQDSEGEIRFVCRSTDGYMLALDNVSIRKPTDHTFISTNKTPKFFATGELEEGIAQAEISVMNTGVPVSGAILNLTAGDKALSSLSDDSYWPTGETRHFRLPLPLTPNERADYTISIEPYEGDCLILEGSFAYCTSFKRHLFVDKGTGMWCNNCPTGTLVIEELEETYGDALIVCETHTNDLLANETYFDNLRYYAIPYMTLNRIATTKGENAAKFDTQICVPTEMEINITGLFVRSDGVLAARGSVSTSEAFTDTDRIFRIGYVLTRDVSGYEDIHYYQKNICTLAKEKQYLYLPSRMTFPMCFFPNVTIPSQFSAADENPAFTGIKGSLPESLTPGETYDCEWEIPLPEGFDSFEGMRLAAYVLDADNRIIINSTSANIDDFAGIEEIIQETANPGKENIFMIDGRQAIGERANLMPGLYIINGEKTLIK